MKYKLGAIVICWTLATTSASCGFKSDLYLPGQQQKIEQYDSRSLKNLGDEKLRQLQKQNDEQGSNSVSKDPVSNEEDGAVVPQQLESQSIEPQGIEPAGNGSTVARPASEEGVLVELPTADEIEREKAKIRQISE